MTINPDFVYSQSSLQDYVNCPRRFYLRYIRQLKWPAQQFSDSLAYENLTRAGERFHRLIHQYLLGLPQHRLDAMALADRYPLLHQWWKNFLAYIPQLAQNEKWVEHTLTTEINQTRLLAKYDLIMVVENQLHIYDWKTAQRPPKRQHYQNHVQTRLYPFVLAQASHLMIDQAEFSPKQIQMHYWFPNFPESKLTFEYSQKKYEQDQHYLKGLIGEINTLKDDEFACTEEAALCKFCVYRSLCERGVVAGIFSNLDETGISEEAFASEMTIDEIPEIEF